MAVLSRTDAYDPAVTLRDLRNAIVTHRIATRLHSANAWRGFMEHHIFAVWDFMTLLKRLQQEFTCVTLPWLPKRETSLARFVNDLVLAEESDIDASGAATSHFELYLRAMADCGADTAAIERVLHEVGHGKSIAEALALCGASTEVVDFVETNMDVALHGSREEITGAFFWGREELIPVMFEPLLRRIAEQDARFEHMHDYLQRHIELDGTDHGPKAEALLNTVCRTPKQRLAAQQVAIRVLRARLHFWDHLTEVLDAAADDARHEGTVAQALSRSNG